MHVITPIHVVGLAVLLGYASLAIVSWILRREGKTPIGMLGALGTRERSADFRDAVGSHPRVVFAVALLVQLTVQLSLSGTDHSFLGVGFFLAGLFVTTLGPLVVSSWAFSILQSSTAAVGALWTVSLYTTTLLVVGVWLSQ
ncbi:MAG: hypothetical protein HKN29_08560 [Rhodothermales bacterium]|nr:hypothetical protein [Rhodothermales bacterium]